MKHTKHTPGPWTTYCYKDVIEICRPKGFPGSIALINNTVDNAEANARLIAAAPDLLAAAEKLSEAVENGALKSESEYINEAFADLVRAVLKARGES